MKRKIMYLLVCSAILIAGCTEEEIMSNYPIADGDEIIFDASAGYPTSRTIYDDYVPGSGNQGISWIDGDQVSIYSPTSPNTTQVDYEVKTSSGVSNTAVLGKIDPEKVGLQWGGNPQKFYAVYPAKQQIQNEAVKELVDFKEGVLTGYIPINQTHEILGKEGLVWKTKPVMEYSYMVAKQTVSEADRVNGVDLNFMPISSAIDVTLKGDGQNTVKISSINIVSQSEQLTGQFTCDLKGWSDKLIYPDCVIKSDDLSRNRVTVDLRYRDNNYIELGPNEQITLTVFLMPQDKLTDLVLRLSAFNMSAKELPLGRLGVEIVPHKKSMVTAKLPVWGKDEVNEWMSGIDDRTYISQLSIPGTANSASYNYEAADAQYYKTQTATIEEQLNAGVRCFELRCTEGSGNDLSTAPLQCNRQNVGMTFGKAMQKFETFLKLHPTEFLMVMPAYESNSGTGGAKSFVQRLNKYLKSTKTSPIVDGRPRYSVYNPERTLGEVRGSIMIIARVTTEEYDEGTLEEIKKLGIEEGVVIEKWGSLKDMWGRRGYSFDGINRIPDYATSYKSWGGILCESRKYGV